MAIAIILILIVVASVLFNILAPWHATPAASNWGSIDTTQFITLIISGIFFIAVTVFMAVAVMRYRHKEGTRAAYQPRNKKLELWLIIVTSVGIAVMLAPGLVVYSDFVRVSKKAYELEVVAQQWQWAFRFPGRDGKLGKSDIKFVDSTNLQYRTVGKPGELSTFHDIRLGTRMCAKVVCRAPGAALQAGAVRGSSAIGSIGCE